MRATFLVAALTLVFTGWSQARLGETLNECIERYGPVIETRQAELAKTLAAWKELPPDGQKRLEALTSAIINKLLHTPTSLLKRSGQGGRTDLYVDALRQMFDLEMARTDEEELGELEE